MYKLNSLELFKQEIPIEMILFAHNNDFDINTNTI